MRKIFFSLLILVCSFHPLSVYAELTPFDSQSLRAIEIEYAGKPFLLAIWSLDCAPCRTELQLLGKLKMSFPGFNLVLISTDHIGDATELTSVLAENHLDETDSWVFANDHKEKLHYSIDHEWSGELPRSYFYNADASRKTHSGRLSEKSIIDFLHSSMND